MFIWIYLVSFVISYLNFLILIFHLFYLVNLVKDFSLIIFSMEQASFIDCFCICLFVSVSFISVLSQITSCHLLFWVLFLPFVLELSSMLLNANMRSFYFLLPLSTINLPFRITHACIYVVLSFSFNSRKHSIFFLNFCLDLLSTECVLLGFHEFLSVLLLLIGEFNLWCSDKSQGFI